MSKYKLENGQIVDTTEYTENQLTYFLGEHPDAQLVEEDFQNGAAGTGAPVVPGTSQAPDNSGSSSEVILSESPDPRRYIEYKQGGNLITLFEDDYLEQYAGKTLNNYTYPDTFEDYAKTRRGFNIKTEEFLEPDAEEVVITAKIPEKFKEAKKVAGELTEDVIKSVTPETEKNDILSQYFLLGDLKPRNHKYGYTGSYGMSSGSSTFTSDEDYQEYLQENLGDKYAKYIEIQQKAKADGEVLTKENIANYASLDDVDNRTISEVVNKKRESEAQIFLRDIPEDQQDLVELYTGTEEVQALKKQAAFDEKARGKKDAEDFEKKFGRPLVRIETIQGRTYKPTNVEDALNQIEKSQQIKLGTRLNEYVEKTKLIEKDQQKLDSLLTQINEYEVEGYKYSSQEELDKRNQLAENYNTLVTDVNSQISVLQAMGKGIEKDFETTEVAGIADAALIKSYKTIDKLTQVMEESFIGAPAMLGGFLLQPFDEGQAYSAAIDYNQMLKNNRANYLPDNLVMDDSSSAGQYLADMLVNNSPSILVSLGTAGSASFVGAAGSVARQQALKQAGRTSMGIFFTMEGGGQLSNLEIGQREAVENIKALEQELEQAEARGAGAIEINEIKKQLQDQKDLQSLAMWQKGLNSFAYGVIAAGAERLGTMSFLKNFQRYAKVNPTGFRKVFGDNLGRTIARNVGLAKASGIGLGIETIEETVTSLGQNASDNLIFQPTNPKSLIEGIDGEFFRNVASTSLAISGPSVSQNIYSQFTNAIRNKRQAAKEAEIKDQLMAIQEELERLDGRTAEAKALKIERLNLINESALLNTEIGLNLLDLSASEIEQVFENQAKMEKLKEDSRAIDVLDKSPRERRLYESLKNEAQELYNANQKILGKSDAEIARQANKAANPVEAEFNLRRYRMMSYIAQNNQNQTTVSINSEQEAIEYADRQFKDDAEAKQEFLNDYKNGDSAHYNPDNNTNVLFKENAVNIILQGGIEAEIASVSPLHEIGHQQVIEAGIIKNDKLTTDSANELVQSIIQDVQTRFDQGKMSQEAFDNFNQRIDLYRNKRYTETEGVDADELIQLVGDFTAIGILPKSSFPTLFGAKTFINGLLKKFNPQHAFLFQINKPSDVYSFITSYQNKAAEFKLGKGKLVGQTKKFSLNTKQDLKWRETDDAIQATFKIKGKEYTTSLEETAFMEFDEGQTYDDLDKIAKKLGIQEDSNGDDISSSERFYHLEFADEMGSTGITGAGDAAEVFSVNINGIVDYLKENPNVEGIVFTAKEPSRIRLYKTLSEVMANKIGGRFGFENDTFVVTNKKIGTKKRSVSIKGLSEVKEKLNSLKDGDKTVDLRTKMEVFEALPTMIDVQVKNLAARFDDPTREELISDIQERMLRINKQGKSPDLTFNGTGQVYGFLNGRIRNRMLDALRDDRKRVDPLYVNKIDADALTLLEKQSEPDPETKAEPAPEAKRYKNLVQSKVLPAEAANSVMQKVISTTRVLKSRIDAAVSLNRTITPLIAEIKKEIGKQADIEFKKMLGAKRGGELRKNLLKLKKPILENMTTTFLMQAMPFAVQKQVDGKFTSDWQGQKIDRETVETDKAGRTSGAEIVRRLPNAANKVSDQDFLSYMFKGEEVIRGRKEALAKAMAEEYAFDLYNQELQKPDSDLRKAFENNQERLGVEIAENFIQEFSRQSERGNVKRSMPLFRQMLDLEVQGDLDGSAAIFETLSETEKQFWLDATADLRTDNVRYKQALKKLQLDIPKNVSNILELYFKNPSARDNAQAMKEYYNFSMAMIKALPNDIVKALGHDFFGAHYRYMNPAVAKGYGAKIKAAIDALPATDSDITLIQAGFGLVKKITTDVLHKEFKTTQEKVDYFLENYGDQVQALNIANKNAIEKVISTAFDLAVKKPQYTVGLLRMLESTTNIGKSLRGLTGISDIQMNAESQAVYINKKTGKTYTNNLTKANKAKVESGEIVINTKHPNYKEAQQAIKDGSKQTLAQLLRIKGEHATPSSNFNVSIGTEFLTALSQALENPGGIELIKLALVEKINELSEEFNQQLNTKVLSDIQDAKLGSTSDIGDLRLLAIPVQSQNAFFDIQGRQTIGRVNRLIKTMFSPKNVSKAAKIETEQKALDNGRKYSKALNPKGISVYDFDDTLAFSKSKVIVKMAQNPEILDIAARRIFAEEFKDKPAFLRTFDNLTKEQQAQVEQSVPRTTKKITPAEFARDSEKLAKEGADFDFSEFNKVVEGTPGPLAPRLKKAISKFGNSNIFVLTARPAESANAIHEFLKGIGLELPLENIVGLANGDPAAKASWMVGKVAEGFNDFYFVDDHMGNVKAVKEVLNNFDVKGKVQQARIKRSKSLSGELNAMIERNKGVRKETTYSKIKARKDGARKGRFKFFLPYGAEDFRGLTSYTLAGKGKQGDADQKWFEDNLVRPYLRGVAAMEVARRSLKNDFRALLKSMPGMKRRLGKKIGDTDYTVDQAVRVYLWTQQGFEIPDISKRDQKKLNSLVSKDSELVQLANGLQAITKQDKWVEPSSHWIAGSILKDINDIGEKVNRAQYLQEFNENVEIIFNEKNMNKLEAIYGTRYVNALKNSLARMKSGRNRPSQPGAYEQQWLNWVNNSVGTIMFFNRRSAIMQTLSFANFINWSDNNPLKAGIAFANQPAYWKAFAEIFNSPKLKERRGGLKSDVQEQEIASQAKNSKDKAGAVIAYLLKIGFTPTQIADSFAIATGGASFLVNRTKTYQKQGMDYEAARAKAFEDFSAISDETQQSGDPMLISAQQASHLGRLVLAFQNTPMQYTRLMKKAAQDIANGRGDFKTNMSKILYYGFVQNLIFSALSNALFALIPGFDEEEPEEDALDKKTERILNNMIDTILRGSGLTGAVISTLKNAIMRYQKEEEKGFTADHAYTILELVNVSPPIGSKARKVYNAIQTKKFDGDVMEAQGWDPMLRGKFNVSPYYEITGQLASAALNLPLDRMLAEVDAISEALDTRNTSYQRLALGLGWRTWDVNGKKEEEEVVKIVAKIKRKEEGKKKAKATREKKRQEELDRLAAMSPAEKQKYIDSLKRKRSEAAKKAAETRRINKRKKDSILSLQ